MRNILFSGRDTLEGSKDVLVKDLKRVVGDADRLLNQMANSTSEEFSAARSKIESTLSDARSLLHDARIAVSEKAGYAADATQKYVSENPWKTVGAIAAVGLIIGILNRRH